MRGLARAENARRCLMAGLLLVVTALITLLLASSALADQPSPAPTPSPSYILGPPEFNGENLEPTPPGLLPTESAKPSPPSKKPGDKPGGDAGKKPTAKEKEQSKRDKMRRDLEKDVAEYKKKHGSGGVLSAFEVTDKNGVPISAYRITAEDGGVTDVIGKMQIALTQGLFELVKWMVAFGCWLIAWALSWSLAAILLKPALKVADSLYSGVVIQLGVPGLLFAVSGVVAAWHIFFGMRSRGWGEIIASTVISALAVSLFASPPQMLLSPKDGAVSKARDMGIAVFAIVLGNEDELADTGELGYERAKKLTRPITDEVVEAFVVRPAILLSYNQSLDDECTELYRKSRVQQALFNDKVDEAKKDIKKAPTQFDLMPDFVGDIHDAIADKAVDYVTNDVLGLNPDDDFEDDCVKDAASAKKPSWEKAGGAAFAGIAALLVMLLLAATAFGYLVTQLRLVIEAILARVALAAGIMPGPGRAWLWERAVTIVRLLGLLVAFALALAVTIALVTTLLDDDVAIPGGLTVRFVVVDVVTIAAFFYRKKISAASRGWAAEARSRMGSSRFGGRAPAQMDAGAGRKRSLASTLATTAVMVGALAATGGSAGTLALGSRSSGALTARLGARVVGRATGAAARGSNKLLEAGARGAVGAGKAGLKYTVGAPVYMPRAARAARAALRSAPGNAARTADTLRTRLTEPLAQNLPQAREFGRQYWNNIGGAWVRDRVRMHRGLPPVPRRPATRPAPTSARRPGPASGTSPAATPARRDRRAPRRVPQPPASARQAALQQQLYRRRVQQASTPTPQPPAPTPPTGPPAGAGSRAAVRTRRGGSSRGGQP